MIISLSSIGKYKFLGPMVITAKSVHKVFINFYKYVSFNQIMNNANQEQNDAFFVLQNYTMSINHLKKTSELVNNTIRRRNRAELRKGDYVTVTMRNNRRRRGTTVSGILRNMVLHPSSAGMVSQLIIVDNNVISLENVDRIHSHSSDARNRARLNIVVYALSKKQGRPNRDILELQQIFQSQILIAHLLFLQDLPV